MEVQTLQSAVQVKTHGSLLRELEKSDDYSIQNMGAVGGDEELQQLKDQFSSASSDIKVTKPNLPLESFVGLKEVKRDILSYLDKSLCAQLSFEHGNYEDNDRIFLFGETGTGKTHLVQGIATELNANLIEFKFSISTVLFKWASNMDLYSKALYEISRKTGPTTIIFLEHLDEFCIRDEEKRFMVRFLQTVQSSWAKNEGENLSPSRLLIFASSNKPNLLDEKLVYAFDRRIYIPTLNLQERRQLLQRMIQKNWKLGHAMAPNDVERVARRMYGVLTSEIEKLVDKATHVQYPEWPVEDFPKRSFEDIKWRALKFGDFEKVLKGFLVLDSKSFFEFETFQRSFGNGPFQRMYEREDFNEEAPGKKGKKKNGLVWTVFSWI